MRCPMQSEKTAAVASKKSESNTALNPRVEFVVHASLNDNYVDTDFVQFIMGKIFAKIDVDSKEKETGSVLPSNLPRIATSGPLTSWFFTR